jgi:DNA invertase Pin-like site-specific DNA recombinase
MARGKFVAYYRVSTARQGRSGLGLEAQREAVMTYLNGGQWHLTAEFTEVESGKKTDKDRPELAKALAACRLHGATLVIAKLDRLARNAVFLLTLRDSGVNFVAADLPDANRLTVGMLAILAEYEREQISARTKAALAAAKRRGVQLGNPENLTDRGRRRGTKTSAEVRTATAEQRAADLAPIIAELRAEGAESLRSLADGLNLRGLPAPRGGAWRPAQVARVLERIDGQG